MANELAHLLDRVTRGGTAARSESWKEHLQGVRTTHNRRNTKIAPTARALGGVYTKQADVLIADWATGVELMITTKSMLEATGRTSATGSRRASVTQSILKLSDPDRGPSEFLFTIDHRHTKADFVFLKNMLMKLVDSWL